MAILGEELVSMRVFELRKFDSADLVRSQMRQADNSSILFETVHKTRDGRAIPVEVSSTGVNFGGSRILMSIIRDISLKQRYLARDTPTRVLRRADRSSQPKELSGRAASRVRSFRRRVRAHAHRRWTTLSGLTTRIVHAVGDKYLTEIGLSLSPGARRSGNALSPGRG